MYTIYIQVSASEGGGVTELAIVVLPFSLNDNFPVK